MKDKGKRNSPEVEEEILRKSFACKSGSWNKKSYFPSIDMRPSMYSVIFLLTKRLWTLFFLFLFHKNPTWTGGYYLPEDGFIEKFPLLLTFLNSFLLS